MNRNSILSFIIVAAGTGALLAGTARSQLGTPKANVNLQPTTPGTSQSGHANVSGTLRASQHIGGGAGLTNVNAAQLGGLSSSAFGQLGGSNSWGGINSFGNNGNSYTGNGGGLFNVNASLLNGLNSSAFLQAIPNPLILSGNNTNAIIHATNTTSLAEYAAAIRGTAFDDITITYGGLFESNSVALYAEGRLTGVSAFSEEGTGIAGYGLYAGGYFSGGNVGVQIESENTGIDVRSQSGTAVFGESYGPFGGDFLNYATNGIGIRVLSGGAGATFGIHASNTGNQGVAVYGESLEGSGVGFGGQFFSHAPTGSAIFTRAESSGNSNGGTFTTRSIGFGAGVQGEAYGQTGPNVGGRFYSESTGGKGVYAEAAAGSGVTIGVHALVNSPDGFAGYFDGRSQFNGSVGIGLAPSVRLLEVSSSDPAYETAHINNSAGGGLRVDAQNGTAVWALTSNGFAGVDARNAAPTGLALYAHATGNSAVNYGVIGHTDSATGWGVFSFGNMGSSGVKPFRIDHPTDPENKYLLHYATESPIPQNFYVGNAVTDSKGYAWVELPEYFSDINDNFKYQLTVVDDADSDSFVIAKVSKEIRSNQFQIRTSAPNMKVSWRVDADRNDLYVRSHPTKDIVEKQGRERGTYQHPELYGMPKERGTNFASETKPASKVQKPR